MTAVDLTARAEELAQEIERHDRAMTQGPYAYNDDTARITGPGLLPKPVAMLWAGNHKQNAAGIVNLRNAAPEIATVLRALVAEVHQLRDRANGIPGLTAALDEARWERDVVLQREPAAGQALNEIERLRNELVSERALVAELAITRPVVAAAESNVDEYGPLNADDRQRDRLCIAVDTMRAQRGGQ